MRAAPRSKRVRIIVAAVIVAVALLAGAAALVVNFDPSLFYPSASSITGLHATRPADPADGIPALDLHAGNAGEAQRVYQAMLDLPQRSPGTYSCSESSGIVTTAMLVFLQGDQASFTVLLQTGGCFDTVQVSAHDVRWTDADFGRMLAASLGVSEDDLLNPGGSGALGGAG